MDRDPHQPLTTTRDKPRTTGEAKERLRAAARNVTLGAVINKRTWPLLLAALAGGYVAARLRLPAMVGSTVIRRAVPILLGALLASRRSSCHHSSQHTESSSLKSE